MRVVWRIFHSKGFRPKINSVTEANSECAGGVAICEDGTVIIVPKTRRIKNCTAKSDQKHMVFHWEHISEWGYWHIPWLDFSNLFGCYVVVSEQEPGFESQCFEPR